MYPSENLSPQIDAPETFAIFDGEGFNTTWPIVLEPHVRKYQPIKCFGITSNFKSEFA